MAKTLVRHDILQLGSLNIDYFMPLLLDKERANNIINNKNQLGSYNIIAESQLFVMPIGQKLFPFNVDALQPMYYEGSKRLSRFLGRIL